MSIPWKAERRLDAVFTDYKYQHFNEPFRQIFLSDFHLDSKLSARQKVKSLLDDALHLRAPVHIIGDVFDAMGGKFDRRTTKKDIKAEYSGEMPYFDAIISDVADFLEPYAGVIATISEGNHESKIREIHEFNLLTGLANELSRRTNTRPVVMGWDGFIKTQFKQSSGSGNNRSFLTYFTHGDGGNATMTFGTLKVKRRQAVYLADVYVSGHIHQAYGLPLMSTTITDGGRIISKETIHIQLAGHKMHGGTWEKSKGMHAVPVSGYWIEAKPMSWGVDLLEIRAK
jgi:hypothetical protein